MKDKNYKRGRSNFIAMAYISNSLCKKCSSKNRQ